MSDVVSYAVADGVATLTIRRPEARNALSQAVRDGLRQGFGQFAADASARALVLAGEGPTFCAGADLKEMAETGMQVPPADFVPTIHELADCDKPVIAAVQGAALGGGFCLALWCDLIVAAEDATFGITEARWGRGAPWASPLVAIVGPRAAAQMLATAEPVGAQRAHEIGLVNEVVPSGGHIAAAERIARGIAALAPLSVQAGVRMVRRAVEHGTRELRDEVQQLWHGVYTSEDAQEGPRAFAEKREPRWQGK